MLKKYRAIYLTFTVTGLLIFAACSKDVLKRYDKRIVGSWNITSVNNIGLGGNAGNIPFNDGTITFYEDRSMTYVDNTGSTFEGSWEIDKDVYNNDSQVRTLQMTAVNFANQRVLTEFYDEINFRSKDHFVAKNKSGFQTYVTHFRR